jgi:hypothetical protein
VFLRPNKSNQLEAIGILKSGVWNWVYSFAVKDE